MNKRLTVFLSLAVMLAMLLAACKGTPTPTAVVEEPTEPAVVTEPTKPAGEMKTLSVWITWGDNPAQIQALFDKYGAANNVKIEVTAPVEEEKILPALTGSNPPDILVLSGGDLVKSYAKENLVDELTGAIELGEIDMDDMFTASLGQCKQGEKVYCLPWGTDLYALYWNKDMFEAAGLDPEKPPATMEELVELADQLTIVGDDGKLQQIGFIPDQAWGHNDLYARMFGGFWYSDDGLILTTNNQAMVDSYTWQQQFYAKYGYDNVMEFSTGFGDQYMTPDQPFMAGKLAMYVDGEWMSGPNFISGLKPELNYGVVAFPPPADHKDRAGTVVVGGTVVVIPAGAKDKEASAKLLAWMMSPEILAEEMCANANLPTSKKAAVDPCFTSNPRFNVFVELMGSKNAFPAITTPFSLELNDAMGLAEEEILHTGADPKTRLDALQAEMEPKFKEMIGQ